jgi:hypothetical protein
MSGWEADVQPSVACPDGLRLLPLADLLVLVGPDGLVRERTIDGYARLRERSDQIRDARYASTHLDMAWPSEPLLSSDARRQAAVALGSRGQSLALGGVA